MRIETGVKIVVDQYGKKVIVTTDAGETLFSYGRPTVYRCYNSGNVYIDKGNFGYSVTTNKQVVDYLREGMKTIRDRIQRGEYQMADLG